MLILVDRRRNEGIIIILLLAAWLMARERGKIVMVYVVGTVFRPLSLKLLKVESALLDCTTRGTPTSSYLELVKGNLDDDDD